MMKERNFFEIINEARREKTTTYFSCSEVSSLFQVIISKVNNNFIYLENNIPLFLIKKIFSSKKFYINLSLLILESDDFKTDGEHLIFNIKNIQNVTNMRKHERFYFSQDEKAYGCFINPYDKETKIERKIIEMSEGGFSMESSFDSLLLQNSSIIGDVTININERKHLTKNVEVVYSKKIYLLSGEKVNQVGCKFI